MKDGRKTCEMIDIYFRKELKQVNRRREEKGREEEGVLVM